jgi:penicillin-binding protein 2
MHAEFSDRETKLPAGRLMLVQYTIFAVFLGLVYGFWQLMVLQQAKYEALADSNRIRTEPILAPRGRILDRYGRVIVDNYPSFSAYIVRDQAQGRLDRDLPLIARGLHLDPDDIQEQLDRFSDAPAYQAIIIKEDITPADVAFVDSHRDEFPELNTLTASRRLYPPGGYLAHVIGYVGEAGPREIEREHLHPGSYVGKFGLEKYYNSILMGTDGERRVLVDSRGRDIEKLSDTPPIPGHDLRLTIDASLQTVAEEALGNRNGAVVALDPRDGDVLAMVSRPTFDPNEFSFKVSPDVWKKLLSDPGHPLLNKAIQAQLAPGSTFKLVMAVAGLEEGIAQKKTVYCDGGADWYGHHYKCWIMTQRHQIHGLVNLTKAIFQSCDVYFYSLGVDLGIDRIARYAKALGLGRKTGIDLPGEAAGLVPTPAWKRQRFHQPWYLGETIPVAIGQGATDVTPLQLARTYGGISWGGVFRRPHLVLADQPGVTAQDNSKFPAVVTYPLHPATVDAVTQGLRDVVSDEGTAASAQVEGVDFGGKTGSAQVVSNEAFQRLGGGHRYLDNSWFVGVYPVKHAEISVCVLFEHGTHGDLAGRIAGPIIAAYHSEEMLRQTQQATAIASAAAPAASSPAVPTGLADRSPGAGTVAGVGERP